MKLKAVLLVFLMSLVLISSAKSQSKVSQSDFSKSNFSQYKSLELTDTTKSVLLKPKLKLKPEAKFEDLVGQFAGGNLAGGLLGLGTGYLGYVITRKGHGEWDGVGGLVIGFVAGHCAGSIIGVYGIGSSKDFTGDAGATILGGVLGTGAGIVTLFAVHNTPVAYSTLAFPTVGAMIGFNSTLRYKEIADKKNVSELKDLGSHLKIKNDFEVNVLKINFQLPKESELSKIPERFLLALR